jgi:hypothetical protein
MVEVEGVGAILAELGDDKELLGKESDKVRYYMYVIVC